MNWLTRMLKELIDEGHVEPDWIRLWYDAGWLRTIAKDAQAAAAKDRTILKKVLTKRYGKQPPRTEGQHDLPIGKQNLGANDSLDLTKEFVIRGLDPNDGETWGHWMKTELHKIIHCNYPNAPKAFWSNGGAAYNYQWARFFRANPTASAAEVLAFNTDLKRRIYSISNPTDVNQIPWIFSPPP